MDKLYEELFRAMNQFRKLKFAEMFPMINRTDFFVMCTIMDKGENGKITISELASRAKMLPSAISRTLKGLEYVCGTDCRGRTSDRGSKADHGGLRQICDVSGG